MNRHSSLVDLRASIFPLLAATLLSGCASIFIPGPSQTTSPREASDLQDDQELTEMMAIMRHDLDRAMRRDLEAERVHRSTSASRRTEAGRSESVRFPTRSLLPLTALPMPIAGKSASGIQDSFGDPRDGGRRRHRGIDLFAPRGTPVVAVTDGFISFIGEQKKAGRCLWLVTDEGISFFYAHLDRWAPGLAEGQDVHRGDLLGFVGNTGNAIHTPSHLHFAVIQEDEALNPYPLLRAWGGDVLWPRPTLSGGFTAGSHR